MESESNNGLMVLYQECICCVHFIRDICFTCTECDNFKLCLQCYISQIELGDHKKSHPFNITDLATFPLFSIDKPPPESQFENETSCSSGELAVRTPTRPRRTKRLKTTHPLSFEYQMDFNNMGFLLVKVVDKSNTTSSSIPYLWRARDEQDFLNAVQFKYWGNWEGIQQELKKKNINVSLREVIEHYNIHYVLTDIGPMTIPWRQYTSRLIAMFEYAAKNLALKN